MEADLTMRTLKNYFQFIFPFVLTILIFSCRQTPETTSILSVSKDSAFSDEIGETFAQKPHRLEVTSKVSKIQEDSIRQFNMLVLDGLSLDEFDQYQINALERYLEAGGTILGTGLTTSTINRYKSEALHRFFTADSVSDKVQVNQFGTGRFITVGHTSASFEEAMKMAFAEITEIDYTTVKTPSIPPDHWFEIDTLHLSLNEPLQFEILPDGNIVFIERKGGVKIYHNETKAVDEIAKLAVISSQSNGLNGMAIAPNFATSGYIYLSYLPKTDARHQRISRFTIAENKLDLSSEKIIMNIPIEPENGWHGTNALEFDSKGNLYISMGDFTLQSADIAGYAQIDERPGNSAIDAQRTSANTNSYYGKILRIHPEADGSYTIPEGNLFPEPSEKTKPEIFLMGCRNPYRFSLDSHTDALYFGDVGPDALTDGEKGPQGYDEVNIAQEAGFFGWPYAVADNKMYSDFDYATKKVGVQFDADHPVNASPNNTGLQELPPSKPAALWYPKGRIGTKFPFTGSGSINVMVGPRYYAKDFPESPAKFPDYFDGRLFIYDCSRNWIITIDLDKSATKVEHMAPFQYEHFFARPIDMKFAADGTLYVLEYGNGSYRANTDATIKRIRYAAGRAKPKTIKSTIPGSVASWKEMLPANGGHHKGRELLLGETCLTCHRPNEKLIGPSFEQIAERYADDKTARDTLAKKIINGGTGNWSGNIIMPANAHLSEEEAKALSGYILSFK